MHTRILKGENISGQLRYGYVKDPNDKHGEYEWCNFLVYHIEHYNIRLPKEFIDKIEVAQ